MPYAPGGATDITARIVGDEIQKITGQSVVVLNKPGAFGLLAIDEMVRAAPDGYTLMVGNVSTNAITPILYMQEDVYFDYSKSVTAVTNLIDVPAFLLATTANEFPVKSVPAAYRLREEKPRHGSLRHRRRRLLSALRHGLFRPARGQYSTWPPCPTRRCLRRYRDMLRGDAQVAFLNVAQFFRYGAARASFVPSQWSITQRLADYPDVPTMKEVGFPDADDRVEWPVRTGWQRQSPVLEELQPGS